MALDMAFVKLLGDVVETNRFTGVFFEFLVAVVFFAPRLLLISQASLTHWASPKGPTELQVRSTSTGAIFSATLLSLGLRAVRKRRPLPRRTKPLPLGAKHLAV